MKQSLLLFGFLVSAFALTAQLKWVARYNGPGNKMDALRLMVVKNGFVYVAGLSEATKGNRDYALVKYSILGNQEWVARYNGPGNNTDHPYGLYVDDGNNVYVTGGSIGSSGTYDYATIKYNSAGQQQWVARYEGRRNDIAKDVKVRGSSVFVTGFADGANQFNGNSIVTTSYDVDNGMVRSTDTVNSLPDVYDGSATNREEGTSLALDANNNIYITGSNGEQGLVTLKYSFDGTRHTLAWLRRGEIPHGSGRKVLIDANGNAIITAFSAETIKYGPDGTQIWRKLPSVAAESSFRDLAIDLQGNVYVTGAVSATVEKMLTVKYDGASGAEQWSSLYTGPGGLGGGAYSIICSGDGFVYVAGRTAVKTGKSNIPHIATLKYEASTGRLLTEYLYDGPDKQGSSGFRIGIGEDGAVYVGGETTYRTSFSDFTTLKYQTSTSSAVASSSILENNEKSVKSVRLSGYPNPVLQNALVEFELPATSDVRLSLLNHLGQEVRILSTGKKPAGIHRVSFTRNLLPAGTFYYRLQVNDKSYLRKVIIVK